jgi:flagellar basal body-associated protein FliL
MNYVIDPVWIYWLQVYGSITVLLYIMITLSVVGSVVYKIFYHCADSRGEWQDNSEEAIESRRKKYRPMANLCIAITIFLYLVLSFIPSKDTIIKMFVAKNITQEKVKEGYEFVKDEIKAIVDYIQNRTDKEEK